MFWVFCPVLAVFADLGGHDRLLWGLFAFLPQSLCIGRLLEGVKGNCMGGTGALFRPYNLLQGGAPVPDVLIVAGIGFTHVLLLNFDY
jgi:hypothetical protein